MNLFLVLFHLNMFHILNREQSPNDLDFKIKLQSIFNLLYKLYKDLQKKRDPTHEQFEKTKCRVLFW